MSARIKAACLSRLAWIGMGTLWIGGCMTDAQLRDFFLTTTTRVFWQAVGTAIQAAFIDAANA